MSLAERESRILDLIAPRLKADGYSVFLHPLPRLLPEFMEGWRPDAIALGKPKNIAIEIVREGREARTGAGALAERFAASTDWELRLVRAVESSDDRPVPKVSAVEIEAAVSRVDGVLASGEAEAALLLGWAILEALGRLFLPGDLSRPQPSNQLVERMAEYGVLTPSEADRLRPLAALRNEVAHGNLRTRVDPDLVADLLAVLRTALAENTAADET